MKTINLLTTIVFIVVLLPFRVWAQKESTPTDTIGNVIQIDTAKNTILINVGGVNIKIKDKTADKKNDTISISKNDKQIKIPMPSTPKNPPKSRSVKTRWLLFDIGLNNWVVNGEVAQNAPFELQQGHSWNFGLHLFKQRFRFARRHLALEYGVMFDFNNYSFSQKDQYLLHDTEVVTFMPVIGTPLRVNRLRTSSAQVPLLLTFESNPRNLKKSFHIGAGVYGGVLLGARTKWVSQDDVKTIIKDDFTMRRIRTGFTGQIGYGPITFYGNFAAMPIFSKNDAYEVRPFSVGLRVVGF